MLERVMRFLLEDVENHSELTIPALADPTYILACEISLVRNGHYSFHAHSELKNITAQGIRLENSYEIKYQEVLLTLGKTKLHIRDSKEQRDLEALILYYSEGDFSGESQQSIMPGSMAMMLENGVICGAYGDGKLSLIIPYTWYPSGRRKLGEKVYPCNIREVENVYIRRAQRSSLPVDFDTAQFKALPEMLTLAMRSFQSTYLN